MKKLFVSCAVLLASCSLAETEFKTEEKVRFDKVYPVELAHYEYEERLQTFYEAEEISSSQLGRLYQGEFPNGETSPQRLRIHWTNARALAQAEVELQKDILGWEGADVSPRPILVYDRSEKFYRYYEYRVLKAGKEIGAVRIPAYRRTEYFFTSEVHLYSDDEKTYTVTPTQWGQYMKDMAPKIKATSSFTNHIYEVYDETIKYLNKNHKISEKDLILKDIRHTILPTYLPLTKYQASEMIRKQTAYYLSEIYSQQTIIKTQNDLVSQKANQVAKEGTVYLDKYMTDRLLNYMVPRMKEMIVVHSIGIYELEMYKTLTNIYYNMAVPENLEEYETNFAKEVSAKIWKNYENIPSYFIESRIGPGGAIGGSISGAASGVGAAIGSAASQGQTATGNQIAAGAIGGAIGGAIAGALGGGIGGASFVGGFVGGYISGVLGSPNMPSFSGISQYGSPYSSVNNFASSTYQSGAQNVQSGSVSSGEANSTANSNTGGKDGAGDTLGQGDK